VLYKAAPEDAAHSPSIDALFFSLAQPHTTPRIGVVLTGMGRDGAAGLLALRKSGALTIAQDAATSVVYGMPKAAAETDAAIEILPLSAIGPRICESVQDRLDDRAREKIHVGEDIEHATSPRARKIPKT
jgi:two-component system, chemotaxis family, response regulator WspF